jgi:phosphatidylethanolamine/phosphatidyl-N-methylethanolamine N-methyltransferase
MTRAHRRRPYRFIAAWLRAPLRVGAVVPSSRTLARAMAAQVDITQPGVIIELGPGTGVITHALLGRGIARERLLVIERDQRMHDIMSAAFPELQILRADAASLGAVIAGAGNPPVCAIVSSLPLMSMPKHISMAIEKQMAELIGDKGVIVQFTYSPGSPINQKDLWNYRLRGKRVKTILRNIPPAHVWVYWRERRQVKR